MRHFVAFKLLFNFYNSGETVVNICVNMRCICSPYVCVISHGLNLFSHEEEERKGCLWDAKTFEAQEIIRLELIIFLKADYFL